jgi:hypothetical protein
LCLKLLEDALADILVVPEYHASSNGLLMSLQAVPVGDGVVLATSRESALNLNPGLITSGQSQAYDVLDIERALRARIHPIVYHGQIVRFQDFSASSSEFFITYLRIPAIVLRLNCPTMQ